MTDHIPDDVQEMFEDIPVLPSGPDLDLLTDLLNDILTEGFDFSAAIDEQVDQKAFGFVAMQRIMPNLGITSPDDVAMRQEDIARMTLIYHEAFLLGVRLAHKKEETGD